MQVPHLQYDSLSLGREGERLMADILRVLYVTFGEPLSDLTDY